MVFQQISFIRMADPELVLLDKLSGWAPYSVSRLAPFLG